MAEELGETVEGVRDESVEEPSATSTVEIATSTKEVVPTSTPPEVASTSEEVVEREETALVSTTTIDTTSGSTEPWSVVKKLSDYLL